MSPRDYWISVATRLADPVLTRLANRTLRAEMPCETNGPANRADYARLEAFGRLLAGLAPWLELGEAASRPWAALARAALDAATDPASPDCANFDRGDQPLVDAAFLAQALLRAPAALWEALDPRVRENTLAALRRTRRIRPFPNNWLLFSATIEAALHRCGAPDWDAMRVDYALRQHEQWYQGDGAYGDGPRFHADYYNSFVIHPMLVDIVRAFRDRDEWKPLEQGILERARRHAAVLERSISPEGTFPPVGRSLVYRFGALQLLGQMALLGQLPDDVAPAQVREALGAVIRRMTEVPGTFDAAGWLTIGFCGAQPNLGEPYISTGSLYLCTVGLLPLGLPPEAPFWRDPAQPWTAVKAWRGDRFPIDHALTD